MPADFFLPHHEAKLLDRGFTKDHLDLFWQSGWVRSVDNAQIQNGLLSSFPSAKGVQGDALLLTFNETTTSLKLDNAPPDPKQDGRPKKYLYARRDPLTQPKGFNTQPWFPPSGETRIVTEGLFDALAATYLIGENCAAATAPSHLKRSKLPASTTIYIGDADCPFHHFTGLLGGMLDGALAANVKLACLPRSPVGNYLYTDAAIGEPCKWGMEEWHREWVRQGLDPKAELQKIIIGALPPIQFLQRCIEEAGDIGIRWPAHAPQISTLAKAIVDATNDKAQRTALRDQLRDAVKAPVTPLNDLIKARTASKKVKHLLELDEERSRRIASGEQVEDPFALWDSTPINVHVSNLVLQQQDPLLKRVQDDSVLYRYDPDVGFWRQLDDARARRIVRPIVERCYKAAESDDGTILKNFCFGTTHDVNQSIDALVDKADAGCPDESKWFLTFTNGTLDLRPMQLASFSADHGTTHHLDFALQLTDTCPAPLLRVAETCYGLEALDRIRGFIRWCIDLSMPWEVIFYFLGGSRSGKGILVELAEALIPAEFTTSLGDPSEIASADKIQQFVQGKKLLVCPEVKPHAGRNRDWSILFQLASHSRLSGRHMRSSHSTNAVHDIRCILAGVGVPDLGKDSAQGLAERARFMRTLPRRSDPDPSLKADLIGTTPEHKALHGHVIGWALAMDRDKAVNAISDPEFKQQRIELQAQSSSVELFIDECLVPTSKIVPVEYRRLIFAAFRAWCQETNHTIASNNITEHKLISLIREALPFTFRDRFTFSTAQCQERGLDRSKRPKGPAMDYGYALREGLLITPRYTSGPQDFQLVSRRRSEGGIQALRESVTLPDDDALLQLWEQQEGNGST